MRGQFDALCVAAGVAPRVMGIGPVPAVQNALKRAGLSFADIKPAYLQAPEGAAAFEQGSLDAWSIWDPFLAFAQAKRLYVDDLRAGKIEKPDTADRLHKRVMEVISDPMPYGVEPNRKALERLLVEKLSVIPGVGRIQTSVVLSEVKATTAIPLE